MIGLGARTKHVISPIKRLKGGVLLPESQQPQRLGQNVLRTSCTDRGNRPESVPKGQNAVHTERNWSEHGSQMTNGKQVAPVKRESTGLDLLEGHRGGPVTHLLDWWSVLQGRTQIGFVFAISTVAFVVLNFYSLSFVGAALRLVTGLIAIVLVPGGAVAAVFLGREMRNLGVSASFGLGLALVECQVLLTITLTTGLHLPLVYFLCVSSSVIVLLCLVTARPELLQGFFRLSFLYEKDTRLVKVLLVALVLRLILAFLAVESISPDSALFADYARSMLGGEFESNVSNELAVLSLWNGASYVIHQAFAYILAVSWLLLPPISVGPIVLLPLVGTFLIIPTYSITKHLFNEEAAIVVAAVVAISPLFVFHSAVGYGPEISSLLFLTYGMIFLLGPHGSERAYALLAGFFIGLVDAIWYVNFYVFCAIMPIILHHFRGYTWSQTMTNAFLFALILLAKLLFRNLLLFFSCWTIVFLAALFLRIHRPGTNADSLLLFFAGIFASLVLWLWPLQAVAIGIPSSVTKTETPLIPAILAPISIDVMTRFAFFYAFHLTIPVLCLLVLALFKGVNRRTAQIVFLCTMIDAAGTLKVLSLMPGSMDAMYLYSDSRFFLLFALGAFVAVGAYVASKWLELPVGSHVDVSRQPRLRRRHLALLVVAIGCVPGYILFPVGTDLVNIRESYGWTDIDGKSDLLGNDSTVFLVDRAREFAWITGRKTAVFWLSATNLSYSRAGEEIIALASRFSTQYLIVDTYTRSHWGVMQYLYGDELPLGYPFLLNVSFLEGPYGNSTGNVSVLTLVAATEANDFRRYARIFEFGTGRFGRLWTADMLDPAWDVGNEGSLVEVDGKTHLVIGPGYNYTYTWRPDDDLNVTVQTGFLLCDLEEVNATVTRVEVYSSSGAFISLAEKIDDSRYYLPLSSTTVGNIAIVIEGGSGESVIIRSVSIWEAQTG